MRAVLRSGTPGIEVGELRCPNLAIHLMNVRARFLGAQITRTGDKHITVGSRNITVSIKSHSASGIYATQRPVCIQFCRLCVLPESCCSQPRCGPG